ncbi:MAG: cupin domain-containing protein [Desulfobulbus sp.]
MLKLFKALQVKAVCLGVIGVLLVVSSMLGAGYSSGVTANVLNKTSVTGDGQKIVYPQTDKAEVTAMLVNIAPGAETGWHKHPIPVYAYVISGDLTVELEGGQRFSYSTGNAIIEVVNTMHNGKNTGAEPVKLAVFYLGAEGVPNVIKPEGQQLVGGDRDTHGCLGSAGYVWCENKTQCVRPWELPPIEHEGPTTKERFYYHCGK